MNNSKIYNRIIEIKKPETGYIVFKHEDSSNYFGKNDKDNIVFMIMSKTRDSVTNFKETKSLIFIYNKECSFILNDMLHNEKVHILICKSVEIIKIQTFIRLTELFSIDSDSSIEVDYLKLFNSLVQLFDKDKSISEVEAQGVFAELSVIKYLHFSKCDIVEFWQSKSKMKFDFMINKNKRVEIKSTIKPMRIHHFLHDQLLTSIYDIIVISVMMQKSDTGLSIIDLTNELKLLFPKNYNLNLFIETHLSRLSYELLYNTKYDESYFLNHIKIFKAKDIPKLVSDIPIGIYNIEYDIVFDNLNEIRLDDFIKWIGERNV